MRSLLVASLTAGLLSCGDTFHLSPRISVRIRAGFRQTSSASSSPATLVMTAESRRECSAERRRIIFAATAATAATAAAALGLPIAPVSAATSASESENEVRSAFGSGVQTTKSAWPFDQLKGKVPRNKITQDAVRAAQEDEDEDVDDEGSVPMKKASKAPVPKPVELLEFADTDAGFSLSIPKGFFKSSRGRTCAINDRTCKKLRGTDLGTLFVAGNLQTAQIVSVQRLSVEQLLSDVGVVPTGDLSSWPAIGKPQKVAELLASFRDGDSKQQNNLPSKVDTDSIA